MAINTIAVHGRLTDAPELRYTAKGTAVACGNIAVEDGYGDDKRTYFFEYAAWG
ncbi:MAG: single-stranded DNA-binding protein, partial [Peptococcaceae bacterium]|nr:single-stranded DNA-binding protein [Peptococcaceae bacterium]